MTIFILFVILSSEICKVSCREAVLSYEVIVIPDLQSMCKLNEIAEQYKVKCPSVK